MSFLRARLKCTRQSFRGEYDFETGPGITGVFGPSGAGKTTLLRCVAGLERGEDSYLEIGGEVLHDDSSGVFVSPEARRVAVVFQDLRLFPHLRVQANLLYGAGSLNPSAWSDVLRVLELQDLLDRWPSTLSGGEARRVAIGRALLSEPRLLLLDEPLAGLDDERKGAVLSLLSEVSTEFRLPIVLVSHSLSDILELTEEIIVLEDGRVIGRGPVAEVLGADEVFRLADQLGLESTFVATVVDHDPSGGFTTARLGDTDLTLPSMDLSPGTRALIAVRPEDVILAREEVRGISAQNALKGVVRRLDHLRDRVLVTVDVGEGATIRAEVTARSVEELGIERGAAFVCLVKTFSFRLRRAL